MSRAESVNEANALSDRLSDALDKTNGRVAALCNVTPPPHGVTLKDAKRAAYELNAMIGHTERDIVQLQALLEMAKAAARRLDMDVALVDMRARAAKKEKT